jgi:hypothetical protein
MSSVYISGPMSGRPGFNYDAFNELATNLREQGYSVLNPADNFGGETDRPRPDYMRKDVAHVLEADCVMALPAWETSRGARLEVTIALELGLRVYDTAWNEITADARAFLDNDAIRNIGRMVVAEDAEALEMLAAHDRGSARTFDTGATRNSDEGKLDYEGFLSPLVLRRFAEYMHACRGMAGDQLRASDNWQKGIPQDVYMKSMWRHFMDVWQGHRESNGEALDDDALCALLFNVMGMLHEQLVHDE